MPEMQRRQTSAVKDAGKKLEATQKEPEDRKKRAIKETNAQAEKGDWVALITEGMCAKNELRSTRIATGHLSRGKVSMSSHGETMMRDIVLYLWRAYLDTRIRIFSLASIS